MRVIIDVTGLPWAREYYRMFPFEPSHSPADDMRLAGEKFEHLEHPTLLDVLQAMVKASAEGETEVLLVAHGNERGLVMKIAPKIQFSAEVSVLKWLPVAWQAFDLIDSSANLAPNQAQLNAWADIAALFEAQADEQRAQGLSSGIAKQLLADANNDVIKACALARDRISYLVIKDPKGLCHNLKTSEKALREVSTLARQVQDASFQRIELRSCNIGAGPGLKALRSFFAAGRLLAPTVHTFYVQVNAPNNTSSQLAAAQRGLGPRWRVFKSDPSVYPLNPPTGAARFITPFVDSLDEQAVVPGSVNFMLKVVRVQVPRYISEASRLNSSVIQPWVARYIHASARYAGSGPFWVGGLDAPTPTGEPYTLPQDRNYRSLIAVADRAG